ncbi:hypothetical protein PF050_11335 [Kosakonia pseudosacchari]|uniref:hypothetical protein n=1 Tax=Kosakonia pseudosacchari TaxID=1646340 RepID=UPI0022F0735F|nr:hypothetical protein [Kosakonia pseudosacchari]WBU51644.1 hypothetical protein PF050_11335 [Kosakonia pseudosacchari]
MCPVCHREDDPAQENDPDLPAARTCAILMRQQKRTKAKLPNKGVMGRSIIEPECYLNGIYTQLMLPERLLNRL